MPLLTESQAHYERVRAHLDGVQQSLREKLDSQEFYELMQAYRWANYRGHGSPADTVAAFEAVKSWVLAQAGIKK